MKVIVPLKISCFSDFAIILQNIDPRVDMIEIWLDQIEDLEIFLKDFSHFRKEASSSVQYLGVVKTPDQGGLFKGSNNDKAIILHNFLEAGGDFIDLDVVRMECDNIASFKSDHLFLSFHDFGAMGGDLDEVLARMKEFNPFLYKFAVTPQDESDLKSFLDFIQRFPKDARGIFTTMGPWGKKGRELIGERSWAGFYALDENSRTATGQKTLVDL